MRNWWFVGIAILAASIGARAVLGHGGSFPPPPSSGPGGSYTGPGDSTMGPGSGPSGPSTGGPGPGSIPVPSGDPDDGPGTLRGGGRPPATPGGLPRGPTTPLGRKARPEATDDRWERWWALHRDTFLAEEDDLADSPVTGPVDDAPVAREAVTSVGADDVRTLVRPALLRALRAEHPIILDSAAIALGRSVAADDAGAVVAELHRQLRSAYPSVRQSALLALGILRHRSSVPILWSVMNDTRQGRQSLDRKGPIASLDRGFAALALGYVGDVSLAPLLLRQARGDDVEAAGAAVLALGLLTGEDRRLVTQLLDLLEDPRIDWRVRAQAPVSLARLGDAARSALPALLRVVRDTRAELDVRRSAVIALGRLASSSDAEVSEALRDVVRRERDGLLRHFALIGIGRLGATLARAEDRATTAADLRDVAGFLAGQVAEPDRSQDRPWAALAAGILGRSLPADDLVRISLADTLRAWLKRSNSPDDEAAACLALGLLRDRDSAELVLDRFRSRRDAATRSHLAIALGLLRANEAEADLTAALIDDRDPGLRVSAAMALARIGNLDAAGRLLELLTEAPTYAATAAIARALGRIGDRRHLAALTDLVEDERRSEVLRGFACVALGMISEKTRLPWNSPLAVGANYAAPLASQGEALDIY